MGRPSRLPGSVRKDIWFEPRQVELLDALRETCALGKPPFTSLVLQAVDTFLARELARPGVRMEVEKYLKEHRQVVNLRDVNQ